MLQEIKQAAAWRSFQIALLTERNYHDIPTTEGTLSCSLPTQRARAISLGMSQ